MNLKLEDSAVYPIGSPEAWARSLDLVTKQVPGSTTNSISWYVYAKDGTYLGVLVKLVDGTGFVGKNYRDTTAPAAVEIEMSAIDWTAFKPNLWYKAWITQGFGPFADNDKVWLKVNTERRLKQGQTFWVFQPKRGVVRHLSKDMIENTIRPLMSGRSLVVGDARESTILNREFDPKVRDLIEGWDKMVKIAKRLEKTRGN